MTHTLEQLRSGQLAGCTRLDLACGLTEFPAEIFTLTDTLEVLNLSGNRLSWLPDDLPRLHKLRVLFCSDNLFSEVPAVLGRCPAMQMIGFKANRIRQLPAAALPDGLRWLILTDNQLECLPDALGECRELQKLMLAGNRLRELPASLAQCHKLELLRIAANRLTDLPHWLLNLPRLAWLAFAGNPLCAQDEALGLAEHPPARIDWPQLTGGQLLGEGASGVIRQALWQTADGNSRPVAVKLFKGAVTSDGLPGCEMNACIAAGRHPNLIGLLGQLEGHPQATPGLVLELIDAGFSTLANPPSLESCTRDLYPADCRFSLAQVLGIAGGIASACAHLHAQAINHGDLYGHNILHHSTGACLLGDFGAASLYGRQSAGTATALEQIEVRAFACLLEELLERCEGCPATLERLSALQKTCGQPEPGRRPLFATISATLEQFRPLTESA